MSIQYTCVECGRVVMVKHYCNVNKCMDCLLDTCVNIADKKRPPIGLYPRFLYDEKRLDDVTQAILRYIDAHKVVPAEWWEEYNELAEREQKRKERIE